MFYKRFFFFSILFWILISINGLCVCWFSEKYLKGGGKRDEEENWENFI